MRKYRKMKSIVLFFAASLFLCGCSGKPAAYMKYGSGGRALISYKPIENTDVLYENLMAERLSVIDDAKKGTLNNNPTFNAEAIFVSNESDGNVIYSKNCFKKLYPASLTKIMTAYVAFKHSPDLNKEIIVSAEARKMPDPYAKVMGLVAGDRLTVRQLIDYTLVPSANDAAKALAIGISGSEENFVKLMNEEAKNLGATYTNFTNCHGLHDKANYTTLYDLYLIFHELLKNDDFVGIVGQTASTGTYKNSIGGSVTKTMNSTNQYFTKMHKVPNGYTILGGKTGTTNEAGSCMLLSASSSDGTKYVVGILKASDSLNLYAQFSTIFDNIPR